MGLSILWFIIILSIIVLSHEFGHFIVARANGIRVIEFTMGFGPTLFSFKKKGTKFSLKLLPLGGACVFDEDIEGELKSGELKEETEESKDEKPQGIAFRKAGVWARISTVFAGPFFNFCVAFLFSLVIVGINGTDLPKIAGLTPGRPAIESGLEVGDTVTKINGERVHIWREISIISAMNQGEDLNIEVLRDGKKVSVNLKPLYSESDGRYYLGIEGGVDYIKCKGFDLFKYSFYELSFQFKYTLKSLKMLILGKVGADNLSGPVGIAQVVDESYSVAKQYGALTVILTMMNIAMLLSVNLGIVNLLPLPALDGGRLIFLFVEVLRGKPVNPKYEGYVHLVGIILFFMLAIFVFYNDILRIIGR